MIAARRILLALAAVGASLTATSAYADTPTPGDIPDNQAFVRLTTPAYSLVTPEGWARTGSGGRITLTDKYNRITVEATKLATPPTARSVTASELSHLRSVTPGFAKPRVTTLTRPAGRVVLVRYEARSPRDPVTGRAIVNDVERYEFWKAGRLAAVTLQAPHGSDNVDPWRRITTSFRWR
jgi:hypothetical protein